MKRQRFSRNTYSLSTNNRNQTIRCYLWISFKLTFCILGITFITGGCYFNHFTQENLDGMEAMQEYKPKEQTQQMPEEIKEPKKGGTITLSMHHPTTLNPLINTDITVDQILKLIFQPLFYVDEAGKVLPNLADNYFYSADGKSLTLTLKSDIQFQDGKYMSVDDIIYSLETLQNPENTSVYKHCVENIQSFSKVDNLTMNIIFTRTSSLSSYSLIFPIIPEHYYGTVSLTNDNGEPKDMSPLGSGSYKFESISKNELMLTASKRYQEKPYISQIKVSFIDDKLSEMYSFDGGLIDSVDTQIMDWGKFSSKHAAKIVTYTTRNYDFIGFNMNSDIFKNLSARKAVANLIHKDKIIEQVYRGHALAADSIIPPDSYLHDNNLADYTPNEKLAKNFFKVTGWNKVNDEGKLYKTTRDEKNNSIDVTLTFGILVNSENEERKKIALMLQKSLSDIGVDAHITELPYNEYLEKLTAKDFDLFIGGWSLSANPDCSFAFHSSNIDGNNFISYSNPQLDELLDRTHLALTTDELTTCFSEIQNHLLSDLPYISIAFRQSSVFLNENISGTPTPLVDNIFFGIEDWFVNY